MPTYCVRERKLTESIDPVVKTLANGRHLEVSVCQSCGAKKTRFVRAPSSSA